MNSAYMYVSVIFNVYMCKTIYLRTIFRRKYSIQG